MKNWIRNLVSSLFGRSLLSYDELVELVKSGVINAPLSAVNGSSIDLTLHHIVRTEVNYFVEVNLARGESIATVESCGKLVMMPHTTALASSNEFFNMPLWLSAEFSLKSTLGRNFMDHATSGWVDPGFNGLLTLELVNNNSFHALVLEPGMKIGQVKFFRHRPVPLAFSYKKRGQYNGQSKVTPAGVVR